MVENCRTQWLLYPAVRMKSKRVRVVLRNATRKKAVAHLSRQETEGNHMQRIAAQPLVYEFSRHREPRARITPGETIIVEAEDALSGQIRRPGDRRDKSAVPYSNPVAGP